MEEVQDHSFASLFGIPPCSLPSFDIADIAYQSIHSQPIFRREKSHNCQLSDEGVGLGAFIFV